MKLKYLICLLIVIVGIIINQRSTSVTIISENAQNEIALPIIMYHSVLKDTSRTGKYIITPSSFKNDLEYLKTNGYTTITTSDLIAYTENQGELPKKPVMITFDDGHYNNYGYVLPLLEEYNMKAIISIVGSYTDEYTDKDIANMTYGCLRWCDVQELIDSPYVEIQNHSYNMHSKTDGRNGSAKKSSETEAQYKQAFINDVTLAQNRCYDMTGYTPTFFTYPFGEISEGSTEYLKEIGLKGSFSCNEGLNFIEKNPDCLFMLKRWNRDGTLSTSKFFNKFQMD